MRKPFLVGELWMRTKSQAPRRTTTTLSERSGVLSGSGSHASSGMLVSVEVAYTASVPLTGNGKADR